MAVQCGINSGFTFDCTTKRESSGGLTTKIWIGNVHEVDSLTIDGSGYVTGINFNAYNGLYVFTGDINQNSASSDGARTDGGNVNFPHSLIITTYDVTPAAKTALEDLAFANGVFAVVQTSSGRFELYGWKLGLLLESMPRSTGNSPSESTARVITLSGPQPFLEKIVLDVAGTEAATLALIEGYEVG